MSQTGVETLDLVSKRSHMMESHSLQIDGGQNLSDQRSIAATTVTEKPETTPLRFPLCDNDN